MTSHIVRTGVPDAAIAVKASWGQFGPSKDIEAPAANVSVPAAAMTAAEPPGRIPTSTVPVFCMIRLWRLGLAARTVAEVTLSARDLSVIVGFVAVIGKAPFTVS